jgi:hypothetical protein
LRRKPIKIGAEVVSHGRCVTFGMAEAAMSEGDHGNPDADRPTAGAADTGTGMRSPGFRCDK